MTIKKNERLLNFLPMQIGNPRKKKNKACVKQTSSSKKKHTLGIYIPIWDGQRVLSLLLHQDETKQRSSEKKKKLKERATFGFYYFF